MNHLALYVPVLAAACAGWLAPPAARRLTPRHATWLLSTGGVVAAVGTLATLGLLAWTLVGQEPGIAAEGRWSAMTLRAQAPAVAIAGAALCALAILLVAVAAGNIASGLLIIVAFSTGLAAVLIGLGLLITSTRMVVKITDRVIGGRAIARWIPACSAVIMVAVGVVALGRAVAALA